MNRLNVLYSFPNRVGVSGIGMTAWHQVKGLVARGVRVTLVCGTCERPIPGLHQVVETMKLGPLKIPYRLLGRDRALGLHDRRVAALVRRLEDTIDVVHCWPQAAIQTLRCCQKQGVKTVLERPNAHTGFAYEAVARECQGLGLRLPATHTHSFNARRLDKEVAEYGLTDCLACPSEFVARTFIERGYPAEKIGVHQYGYDPAVFYVPAGAPGDRPFTAVFVGSCEPRKGLHYALRAWVESGAGERGKFLICGKYVQGYREVLLPWLRHPSIEEMGFSRDVAQVIRRCDALVLSSVEEGSALVTYEGRASGCVLVVSDATGARARHMQDALVHNAGNWQALRDHFAMLANDPALLSRLRAQSLANIGELSWDAAARQLESVYQRVLCN